MLFDVEPQLLFKSSRYPRVCFVQEWLQKIAAGKLVTAEDRDVAAALARTGKPNRFGGRRCSHFFKTFLESR